MKKRYVLSIDGEHHSAVVAHSPSGASIEIDDDAPVTVNAHSVLDGHAISLRLDGRHHLIHLSPARAKGDLHATIAGRTLNLTVMDELRAQALDSLDVLAGSGTLAADIPGLVVEIKVKPGQVVHQGEPLIVIEAMKMQNELTAGVGGTVTSIPVEIGQAVNPGDTLIVVEPEPGG